MKYLNCLEEQPKWFIVAVGLCLAMIVGLIDYIILVDVALVIFYLFPIFLMTWYVNRKWGIIVSVINSLNLFIDNFHVDLFDTLATTPRSGWWRECQCNLTRFL